jgi:hypothetical protein
MGWYQSLYVMRLARLRKSHITIDSNVKLWYTYTIKRGKQKMDFFGRLLVVVAVGYLAYHVVVDLLLA